MMVQIHHLFFMYQSIVFRFKFDDKDRIKKRLPDQVNVSVDDFLFIKSRYFN